MFFLSVLLTKRAFCVCGYAIIANTDHMSSHSFVLEKDTVMCINSTHPGMFAMINSSVPGTFKTYKMSGEYMPKTFLLSKTVGDVDVGIDFGDILGQAEFISDKTAEIHASVWSLPPECHTLKYVSFLSRDNVAFSHAISRKDFVENGKVLCLASPALDFYAIRVPNHISLHNFAVYDCNYKMECTRIEDHEEHLISPSSFIKVVAEKEMFSHVFSIRIINKDFTGDRGLSSLFGTQLRHLSFNKPAPKLRPLISHEPHTMRNMTPFLILISFVGITALIYAMVQFLNKSSSLSSPDEEAIPLLEKEEPYPIYPGYPTSSMPQSPQMSMINPMWYAQMYHNQVPVPVQSVPFLPVE